jgi:uncharacterized membrane protein YkoI
MKRPRTQTALAAALLLAAAALALAAPPSATTRANPDSTSTGRNGRRPSAMSASGAMRSAAAVPRADLPAAKSVKVSLTEAIGEAERHSHGRALAARFELLDGRAEYRVKTYEKSNDEEWIGHIDARSGKLLGRARAVKTTRLLPEDQQELTAAHSASTSLAQAVKKAERREHGRALAADMSARNGAVAYRTELLERNGMTRMASVDPQSGKVTAYR